MSDSNDIRRGVGDDWPITLEVTSNGRTPVDISSGYSSTLYVYDSQDPDARNELFSISGVVADGPGGIFSYSPVQADIGEKVDAYYLIKVFNSEGKAFTIKRGVFVYD